MADTNLKKYHIDYNFLKSPMHYGDTVLVQIGRLYCSPSFSTDKHAHINWYELTVITDGSGVVLTNDVALKVKKGDIYLSYPGDFHQILSDGENPLKYDFFSFYTKNPELEENFLKIASSNRLCADRVFCDENISARVSDAISEMATKQKFHTEILSLLFNQIILYVIRNFSSAATPLKKKHLCSGDELCFQIMHHIDTHIYTIKNLAELSNIFNYNYSYLSAVFKKNTHITIADYYHSRRLDAASLLLKEGILKVNQIAEMLGYSSMYSFSKAFKLKYGISPKNYAKDF